ncbi:MAG: glycoside hydrolase family 3 C-terminal domain-containing protein [Planctomycetes bacterium]|nr:glycoside hydrolase family 3 C-terminal domain-containing protein [Planctomycetota bacterium]
MRNGATISLVFLVLTLVSMGFAEGSQNVTLDTQTKAHDWFGWAADVDGQWAVAGARYDDESGSNSGAAYVYKKEGVYWKFAVKLKADTPEPDANFGYSVAIKGDYIIVGAQLEDAKERDSGAAYVFKRQQTKPTHQIKDGISQRPWIQVAKLVPANGQQYDQFGFSVDIQDDYAVVGAIVRCDTEREANLLHGGAYVFENGNDSWKEVAYLKKDEPRQGDQLGQSIAIEDDCIYIGGADNGKGAVHVFKLINGNWRYADAIEVAQGTRLSRFATSLDIDNGNLIVGSKFEDNKGRNSGCAYIYRKTKRTGKMSPSQRSVTKQFLLAEDGTTAGLTMEYFAKPDFTEPFKKVTHTGDIVKYSHEANEKFPGLDQMEMFSVRFTGFLVPAASGEYIFTTPTDDGSSLFLDGKHVNNQTITLEAGRKYDLKIDYVQQMGGYVMKLLWQTPIEVLSEEEKQAVSHSWQLVLKLEADDSVQGDTFGTSVNIDGDYAVVSAPYAKNGDIEKAGVAYLYKKDGDQWKQVKKYQSSDPKFRDRFGSAVAISGNDVFVGAMNDDENGYDSGGVYTFFRDDRPVYLDTSLSFEQRVSDLMGKMNRDQKIGMLSHNNGGVPQLGIKPYHYWSEALHGVMTDHATSYPQAIAMAASWDPQLVKRIASATGDELRARVRMDREISEGPWGVRGLFAYSPVVNIGRDPRWGRNQEGYGEDPYLVSRIAVGFIQGFQGIDDGSKYLKAVATPKHFVANNEEWFRRIRDAKVPVEVLREYYFPGYKASVMEGGAMSLMTAFNGINGTPCAANKWMLTEVLRDEWGFKGFVVSDCGNDVDMLRTGYTKTQWEGTGKMFNAGLDMLLGGNTGQIGKAINNGLTSEKQVDLALKRIFTARFMTGEFDPPAMVEYNKITIDNMRCKEHLDLSLEAAKKCMVLLKNDEKTLPLDKNKIKSVVMIGPFANSGQLGAYSGIVAQDEIITPLEGFKQYLPESVKVEAFTAVSGSVIDIIPTQYFTTVDENGKMVNGLKAEYFQNNIDPFTKPEDIKFNTNPKSVSVTTNFDMVWFGAPTQDNMVSDDFFTIRLTGKFTPPVTRKYNLTTRTDDGVRYYLDGKLIIDSWGPHAATIDNVDVDLQGGKSYDVKIEFYERTDCGILQLGWDYNPGMDENIKKAAEIAAKSDVALLFLGIDQGTASESRDITSLDLPYYQKELAKAVKAANPNTVLVMNNGNPMSVNWCNKNIPAIVEMWYAGDHGGLGLAQLLFGDGNFSGKLPQTFYKSVDKIPAFDDYDVRNGKTYLYADSDNILFPFGHGLSYTSFKYGSLKLAKKTLKKDQEVTVSFKLTNTGKYEGAEVAQLYVHSNTRYAKRPIKELKRFKKVMLKPAETKTVEFKLPVSELARWDSDKSQWIVDACEYNVMIGSSSTDIKLKSSIKIAN